MTFTLNKINEMRFVPSKQMKMRISILLLIAIVNLTIVIPVSAQQQIASVNRSDAPTAMIASNSLPEELRAQLKILQKRRDALKKYLSTVNLNLADYRTTELAIQDLDNKLYELNRYVGISSQAAPASARIANADITSINNINVTDAVRDKVSIRTSPLDLAPPPQPGCFPDAPPALLTLSSQVAQVVVNRKRSGEVDNNLNEMLIYSLASSLNTVDQSILKQLEARQVREETKRADKQVGASARSNGTTTNVEKPNVINYLAIALENGAVTKLNDGTTLTLKTSPYALVAAIQGDTATTYKNNPFLTGIDFSASFNISNQNDELANVRRSQLSEWSGRIRLTPDTTTRSKEFEDFWDTEIRPVLQKRSSALTLTLSRTFNTQHGLQDTIDKLSNTMRSQIDEYFKSAGNSPDAQRVSEIIICTLKSEVVDKVKAGSLVIPPDAQQEIARAIKQIFDAELAIAALNGKIKDKIEELNGRPVVTFGYLNKREAVGSDYSVLKFLLEKKMYEGVEMDGNIGVSLYHNPNRAMNQQTVRDLFAALSFQFNAGRSPFLTSGDLDQSQVTLSFNGRYQRMMENKRVADKKADIASAQFRLEIPIIVGLSIPFAITYSNSTEISKKDRLRANFGLTFDADKLMNLKRAASNSLTGP